MKDLLKLAALLGLVFASTFYIANATGLVDEHSVRAFLTRAHQIEPLWFVLLVIAALWIDLLIAVPTMATIVLAGYFLGPVLGALASVIGLMLMGATGYAIGHRYGRAALTRFYKDQDRLAGIEAAFARNDLLVLFVCQALPILPELACCLAGIARIRLRRFLLGYAVGVVPFATIVAWSGSISTLADPSPAILVGIAVSAGLLVAWRMVAWQAGRRDEAR